MTSPNDHEAPMAYFAGLAKDAKDYISEAREAICRARAANLARRQASDRNHRTTANAFRVDTVLHLEEAASAWRDLFRLRALLRVAPGQQGHAKFSRTFAPDLCIEKAQQGQWPARGGRRTGFMEADRCR